MSNLMAVLINGSAELEYRRDVPLTDKQREFLDRMDKEMDAGIRVGDQTYAQPDETQRAQYVALQLVQALQSDQEQLAAATCSYLAERLPELKQVKAETHADGAIGIDLIFTEAYNNQVKVSFSTPQPDKNSLH